MSLCEGAGHQAAAHSVHCDPHPAPDPEGRKSILVVEDERVTALDLKKTLEDLGYTVSGTPASASDALTCASERRPDLVLMDIHLRGDVDGIAAASHLRTRFSVPIVFLTGSSDERTLQEAIGTAPDGYLLKPIVKRSLRSAVELALHKHDLQRELREANRKLASQKKILEHRSRDLELLSEMGELLQVCDNDTETLSIAARYGRELFGEDGGGGIFLFDASRALLESRVTWGDNTTTHLQFTPDECRGMRMGRVHRVFAGERELRCAHLDDVAEPFTICVPMLASGDSLGVLSVWSRIESDGPNDHLGARSETEIASVFAQRIAVTLATVRIKEKLRKESSVDPLTGLFNRRFLETAFNREIRLAERSHRPVGVILFDIDNFKRINDTFGHVAADAALNAVAKTLRLRLRGYDVPGRYGGDELLLLLPDTSLEDARKVAEQVRSAVTTLEIPYGGLTLPSISASFGVAAYPLNGKDMDSLVRAADAALYQAKGCGRNCVVVSDVAAAGGPTPVAVPDDAPSPLRDQPES